MIWFKEKSERGSAFILALMVVAAVGLLVVPVIYLASTGLRSTNLAQQRFLERYAADAGVEEGIWHIEYDPLYEPTPDVWFTYYPTFNNQQMTVKIKPAGVPTPMYTPTPVLGIEGGAILVDTTVDPNIVAPNSGLTQFRYTLYLYNYGASNLNIKGFGVCLPVGFQYVEMEDDWYQTSYGDWVDGRIQNLEWGSSGDPFILDDPDPDQAARAVPFEITFDTALPCLDSEDPTGTPRTHVYWDFPPSNPGFLRIPSETRASITFRATATLGGPAVHYDTAWINSNEFFSLEEQLSPVVVKWGQFDIRSRAGGTTVEARTSLDGDTNETYIDSWQVE